MRKFHLLHIILQVTLFTSTNLNGTFTMYILSPLKNFSYNLNTWYVRTYVYTTILTYSMVQNPSWEANWFAASQEIPRISWNPKVHYHTHKRPPSVSILGQPNPVHTPISQLLEIHPNIIHPSTPGSPQWSPSLRLMINVKKISTFFPLTCG